MNRVVAVMIPVALALLLLAAPAMASEEDSCAATAQSLDDDFYVSDILAANGRLTAAGNVRNASKRGVEIFTYTCLKPRVCPAYFSKFQYWFPPSYSKTGEEFTGFRNAWRVATTTGCE